MPLIEEPRDNVTVQNRTLYPEETKPVPPDRLDLWAAGMALQNPISGAIRYGLDETFKPEQDYNPFRDDDIEDLDPQAFAFSRSRQETEQIKQRMKAQRRDRAMLEADESWHGTLAGVAGSIGNPIIWAPMLIAPQAGVPALIAMEAGAEAISETLLHAQQPERTLTESAVNVAATAFVVGVLGSAAQYLGRDGVEQAAQKVADDFKQPSPLADIDDATRPPTAADSAGAQRADETTLEQETLIGGDKVTYASVGPLGRVLRASSVEARKVAQQLANPSFMMRKFSEGKTLGPSVEAKIGRFEATESEALNALQALFKQYSDRTHGTSGRLDEKGFFEAVSFAARRNDAHSIPEVRDAAVALRQSVFDPTKFEAQQLKLLPEDRPFLAKVIQDLRDKGGNADHLAEAYAKAPDSLLPNGQTYLPRMYDMEKLAADLQGFKRLIVQAIQSNQAAGEMIDAAEAEELAESVIRNVFLKGGLDDHDLPKYIVPKAGVLQERTIKIPDALLEPYLVNDARILTSSYLRQIGSDIELTKTFGNKKMGDVFSRIADEYDRMIAESSGKEATRLKKERSNVFRDLKAMRDRLTGQYDRPQDPTALLVQAGAWIRVWNTMSMLGGVVLSSISDIGRPIMELGLRPYMKGLTSIVTNLNGFNLSRAELKRWGVGLDMTNSARMMAMADASDMMQGGQQKAMHIFGQVSLMNAWNAGMKQFTGVMASDTFIQWAGKKMLTKHQKQIMARAGLDQSMLPRIADQFKQHGNTVRGLRLANTDAWEDREAAEIFAAAIRQEVNHTIIVPGIGDKPLVASTEVGKLALQFQSFIMSANNRMLINGLQRHDRAFMTGIIVSVFMGMMIGWIKNAVNGKEQPDNEGAWLAEGVDRSGVLGMFSYPFNWTRAAMGDQPSRFAARNAAGAILGPTPGQIERVAKIGFDASEGEFDAENAARLMPFQNLWHLRQIAQRSMED